MAAIESTAIPVLVALVDWRHGQPMSGLVLFATWFGWLWLLLPFLVLYLVLPFRVGTPCTALVGAGTGLQSGHLALGHRRLFIVMVFNLVD